MLTLMCLSFFYNREIGAPIYAPNIHFVGNPEKATP